ncbi:MAG: sigma-54-dependent transcriptional regulator [Gammaproteobacteria bacterium]|jgi:two-component system response regulator PilR (NtrC family)
MSNHLALIIDDEPDILELLKITLSRMNIDCKTAGDLKTAKQLLSKHKFHICLADMKLPDGSGVEFISYIQDKYQDIPIAIISAHGSIELAIQALKLGAFDFLTKPVDLQRLRQLIDNALKLSVNSNEFNYQLIGISDEIQEIRKLISKLARSQAPLYISGESGVGKELVARMIHEQGPRSKSAFVPVNCGAISQDLMESEFFGHKKGSFTGADVDKEGLFNAADSGTLFLDEIAELPQSMQVKLLRAIQEKNIRSIGSQHEKPVDVRILSATHKNLAAMVETGQFRKDLFYRINVIELYVPPLRERKSDIPLLVTHMIEKILHDSGNNSRNVFLTDDAITALLNYSFPGNIRELENIVHRAIALSDGDKIDESALQLTEVDEPINRSKTHEVALDSFLAVQEKEKIINALEKTRWNKTAAAKILGVSFRALRYRLEKLGIE